MAEKPSGGPGVRVVSQVAIEMRNAIVELAGNRAIFDSRSRWLARAASKAGISARMAKALFYCEVADPKSSIVEQIRAAQAKKRKDAELLSAASQTYADFNARLQRLEAALRISDPDFHSDTLDALSRMDGGPDRPLD